MKRNMVIALGVLAVLAETALWHGPLGVGGQLAARIENAANSELKRQEMVAVSARLERSPLRRRIVLSGPADDFQHRELVRIMDALPGVSGVRWTVPPSTAAQGVK